AVIVGTLIPLVVYLLWQWLIIGALDASTLENVMKQGMPVTVALQNVTKYPMVAPLATAFALFAIITSVLGVSFSLVDFLGDGLKIKRRVGWARIFLTLMTFIPPLVIAATRPDIFDDALGVAGGFGEAYLNGLLPIALVWAGRYRLKIRDKHLLPGGKASLSFLAVLCLAVVVIEAVIVF
ncbi:MAG: aromatic amino acid transport family protein, partial [Simkaniaceae bacterium]|nr:aromatic amino acid transport family protein [Simkaniaceae bacterium]